MSSLHLVSAEGQQELARVLAFGERARRDEAERVARALARVTEKSGQRLLQRSADRGPLHPGPAAPPPTAA